MSSWLLLQLLALALSLALSLSLYLENLPKERTNGQPLTSPAFVFPFRHFVFPFNIYISLCEAGEAKRGLMKNAQRKRKMQTAGERKREREAHGVEARGRRHQQISSANTASLWFLHASSLSTSPCLPSGSFHYGTHFTVKQRQAQTHTHTHAQHTRKVS